MSAVRAGQNSLTVLVGPGRTALPRLSWAEDPAAVRAAVDALRVDMAPVVPDDAHEALARLQQAMGAKRCVLLTLAPDGLLQKAAAADVVELAGSIWRLRCSEVADHPRIGVFGNQDPSVTCATCGSGLRPDVVLPGDAPEHLHDACEAVVRSRVFLVVDADPTHDVVDTLLAAAHEAGVRCWHVGMAAQLERFDQSLPQPGYEGLPRLVRRWLQEDLA